MASIVIVSRMTAGYAHNGLTHCSFIDWAYVEDFARRLTTPFSDVYVFTVPLYLPKQERDGKWRVVRTWQARKSKLAEANFVPFVLIRLTKSLAHNQVERHP